MTDDTMRIAASIVNRWYEHCFDRHTWSFHDGEYRIADDNEYETLGENPDAAECPLILVRVSDGTFFEVELDATVWQTTPQERQEHRDQLTRQLERATAARQRREGRG